MAGLFEEGTGFYWVKFRPNTLSGSEHDWTVAKYTEGGRKYPVQVIGSEDDFSVDDFREAVFICTVTEVV